jgi:hypothetical protein
MLWCWCDAQVRPVAKVLSLGIFLLIMAAQLLWRMPRMVEERNLSLVYCLCGLELRAQHHSKHSEEH